MRLYGTWFQNLFTAGRRGPVKGLLLDHFQLQDVITVAPDGQTAKGRFRGLLAGGWHDDVLHEKPNEVPQQFWESGIYENDYVKEDGVWKIKSLRLYVNFVAPYEKGWARLRDGEGLMPSEASKAFPPDRPSTASYPSFPAAQVPPFQARHPVTGRSVAGGRR